MYISSFLAKLEHIRYLTVLQNLRCKGILNLAVHNHTKKWPIMCICYIFWHKTKGHEENGTALQPARRRYKREWVKFAKPCREREDNSKRNPIAKVRCMGKINIFTINVQDKNQNNMGISKQKHTNLAVHSKWIDMFKKTITEIMMANRR